MTRTVSSGFLALALLAAAPALAQGPAPDQGMPPVPPPAALPAAPMTPAELACRTNLVRLWVAIKEQPAGAWFTRLWSPGEAAAAPAARPDCLALLDQPLIRFEQDPQPAGAQIPMS